MFKCLLFTSYVYLIFVWYIAIFNEKWKYLNENDQSEKNKDTVFESKDNIFLEKNKG